MWLGNVRKALKISNFEWVGDTSFKKDFMKNYNEKSDE